MEIDEQKLALALAHADPVTAASIRARLILIQSLGKMTGELRHSREVIGGIIDDMSRNANELKEAIDKL